MAMKTGFEHRESLEDTMKHYGNNRNKTMANGNRMVYGATCTWWDGIDKIAKLDNGLPCCPHCHSVLLEMDEAEWFRTVDSHQVKIADPNYRAYVEWMRGKCFTTYQASRRAFNAFKLNEKAEA